MTGKHAIHTGTQHRVLYAAEPRGISLNEVFLPQYLKEYGYKRLDQINLLSLQAKFSVILTIC